MRYIYLIRHGETENNKLGVDQGGGSDSSLSLDGLLQCEKAAEFIGSRNISFEKVITSGLGRTKTSAKIINKPLNLPVENYAFFNERSKGDWEGKKKSDYLTEELKQRMFRDEDIKPPNGESYEDVQNRCYPHFKRILKENKGNLLFILHGNVIRCILSKILGMTPALSYRFKQDFCCFNVLSEDEHERMHVEYINFVPFK